MGVGLDIGSKTIKIIELSKEGNVWRLDASGIIGYAGVGPDAFRDEKEMLMLSSVIKKLHAEAKISSKEVAVAFPESAVFTRTIKLPLLSEQEIASAIKWEAEQYIPIPASEAIIQHQVLERKENASPPEVTILLVAAPRVLVEKYLKVVQAAGLTVTEAETELISLVRALAPVGKTVMLLDFGARSTDIAIAKNAQLYFSRSIPTAGEAFTRAVAQVMNMEYQQAEQYKRAYGLSSSQLEGKIKSAIDPVFKIVADEIKKAIHFYQTEEEGEAPSSIILSGGTSGMPQAISFLNQLMGIEIQIGNPFARVTMSPEVLKAVSAYGPLYAIAVGLAQGI